MSHSHIRVHGTAPQPKPQHAFWGFLACVVLAVISLLLWNNLRGAEFWERHSSAEGMVSDTRVVLDHTRESLYGGQIYYRLEAHVAFQAEGLDQDRWLTVPEDSSDRVTLMIIAAGHPKSCRVYWVPGHSENAKCNWR